MKRTIRIKEFELSDKAKEKVEELIKMLDETFGFEPVEEEETEEPKSYRTKLDAAVFELLKKNEKLEREVKELSDVVLSMGTIVDKLASEAWEEEEDEEEEEDINDNFKCPFFKDVNNSRK